MQALTVNPLYINVLPPTVSDFSGTQSGPLGAIHRARIDIFLPIGSTIDQTILRELRQCRLRNPESLARIEFSITPMACSD
jgi:hypothetical protein